MQVPHETQAYMKHKHIQHVCAPPQKTHTVENTDTLMWRLLNGQSPEGQNAKLIFLMIGSNSIYVCTCGDCMYMHDCMNICMAVYICMTYEC